MRRFVPAALAIFLAVLTLAPASADAYTEGNNNPFGIMTLVGANDHSNGLLLHFQLARELVGEWGYVRVVDLQSDIIDPARGVRQSAALRANHLIPVYEELRMPNEYMLGNNIPDTTRAYEYWNQWYQAHHDAGTFIPYMELGNEINNGSWDPEIYAHYLIEISKALKDVDPRTKIVTAGMAGNGADFYDEMLTAVPEVIEHVDYWGLHPYPANHPPDFDPEFEDDDYCVRSYEPLADLLRKHGVEDPEFIMTETGWELGVGKDRRFPRITSENRTEYIVIAYERYWRDDPTVRALMPFVLMDPNWKGWNGWDFVDNDWTKTPMFKAMAAIAKPQGSDYLPTGPGVIRGRITEPELGTPVDRAIVYIRGDNASMYAAYTDEEGRYEITGIPLADNYRLDMFRDGYAAPAQVRIDVTGGNVTHNAEMNRTSYINGRLGEGPGPLSPGWQPYSDQIAALDLQDRGDHPVEELYAIDRRVTHNGRPTQKILASPTTKHGLWTITGYQAALPDTVYRAVVWVKTSNLELGGRKGARLVVEMADSDAVPYTHSSAAVARNGNTDWTPLTVIIPNYTLARRIKVLLEVDADAGAAWFSDLYLHEAEPATPREREWRRQHGGGKAAGKLEGAVSGLVEPRSFEPQGIRLQDAIVTAEPGGYYTHTLTDGRYIFEGLPAGTYTLRGHAPGWQSGVVEKVTIAAGEDRRQDIELTDLDYPRELINPGFEAPGATWPVAGWQRFGTIDGVVESGWHQNLGIEQLPEGMQAYSGNKMFASLSGSNVKNGGFYQTIEVEADALYEVSCKHWTFQTEDGIRYDVLNRLGVDPLGGTDETSPYIQWTAKQPSHLEWSTLTLQVRPILNKMTIFLEHIQIEGIMFNANAFDEVTVRKIGEPDATAR